MQLWHRRGHYQEGSKWLTQGLTLSGSENLEQTAIRAKAYYAAGYLSAFHDSDTTAARAMIEESIRRFRRIDHADQGDIVLALSLLAVEQFADDPAAARTLIAESVAIGRKQGPSARWNLAGRSFRVGILPSCKGMT